MISKLILFSNFLVFVVSDGYICQGGTLVNPPLDLTEPFYFPENWNEGLPPATFNASQYCNWRINMLEGMYATVTFYKDADGADSSATQIFVDYPNGDNVYLQDNDDAPYIFTKQQFQISLIAHEKQGKFSFKVVWSEYPAEMCKINIPLDQYQLIPQASTNCAVTFTAPNKVWLIAFNGLFNQASSFLRHSAVFEGGSVNGNFLGTLDKANGLNIWSNGKSLTVYTFGMQMQDNRYVFLGMDANAAGGNVQRFDGLDCTDTPPESCYVYAYSYDVGNKAVITASRNIDYLYYVRRLAENATLSVYEGQIDKDHLLTTISGTNYNQKLPLAVKNTVKIYKVDTMLTQVSLTNDSERAGYGKIAVLTGTGMQTVVHSFDYRQLSLEQDTFETFTADILVNFKFNVVSFDVNGNTTLDIEIYQNGLTVLSETFTKDYKPRSSGYTAFGDKISVKYQTYGRATKGFEVDFACTSKDATTPQPTTPKTTAIPKTTVIQSTVSTPVITTEKIITTTKGSSQNYALICFLAEVLYLLN
ncbi:hypothetical protein CAEBREN_06197 [Caenorhabditis brenneri]|uniref:CUB-like domain-containing protein n=1 Tax=Caenorhabditis brenneri TaxID=135651 RepID=G0NN06_CAEBE|nr:hypothetical protein CAEBREN_06197 [Caenorhabditis brenneri]